MTKEQSGSLVLYRCDSLPSENNNENDPRSRISTWIDTFKTDGLITKAFRHTDPRIFAQVCTELPYYVAAHVGYEKDSSEMEFTKKKSPFLSFARNDIEKALYFLDREGKKAFEDCRVFEADHFIFKLEGFVLSSVETAKFGFPVGNVGLYEFQYEWNFDNFQHIQDEEVERVRNGDTSAVGTSVLMEVVKQANSKDPRKGIGILIDVESYLTKNFWPDISEELINRAVKRAKDKNEWLLLPIEESRSVPGVSGRFSPNRYLKILKWIKQKK